MLIHLKNKKVIIPLSIIAAVLALIITAEIFTPGVMWIFTPSAKASDGVFYVRVEDSGIGIPEESINKIFERFYRVDKARSRETGGTGLGLAIVKNIVLMHHGTIKVHSEENIGTTFTMRIPLNYVDNQQ